MSSITIGSTLADLMADAAARWGDRPDFETPRFFEFCADLPRTESNKIHKSKLRFASTPP